MSPILTKYCYESIISSDIMVAKVWDERRNILGNIVGQESTQVWCDHYAWWELDIYCASL